MPARAATGRQRSTSFSKCSTAEGVDMKAARLLVWMVALVALMAPPGMTVHAMAPPSQATSTDCPDHMPPPDPCPDHGTAKHTAGDCCSLMSCAPALLPVPVGVDGPVSFHPPAPPRTLAHAGRIVTQDPPPPRA